MAIDIEYYRKISGSYGCDNKQDQIKSSIANEFKNQFNNGTLGYETILINNLSKGVIIQNKSSKNSLYILKEITMQPNDILNMGDLIEWNNSYWLCTQSDNVHGIYYNGTIRECNNVLKFYNNYILYEVPCVFDTSLLVEDEKQYMTLSKDNFSLFCKNDGNSTLIDYNTRFLLDGYAYKVEGIDNLKYKGILEIKLKKDQITVNDRVDLGVADWGINQPSYQVTILNGASAELFYGNETLQLNVEVKRDGVVLTNPTITYTTSNALVATVSTSGLITCVGTGDCSIFATYSGISDSIAIYGDIDQQTIYTVTITPTISTIKANTSMALEAYGMNNGVEDLTREFNWTIRNSDNSNNVYATIVPNNKTCLLTAKGITNKFIIVRVTLTSNPTVYFDKEIKIINLF